MNNEEYVNNSVIDTPAVPVVDSGDPTISSEEFRELAMLRNRELTLKDRGFLLHEEIEKLKTQINGYQSELDTVRTSVSEIVSFKEKRFNEILSPLGLNGELTIEDQANAEGRHRVLVVQPQQ